MKVRALVLATAVILLLQCAPVVVCGAEQETSATPQTLPDSRRHDEAVDSEEELRRHNEQLLAGMRAKKRKQLEERASVHDSHIRAHELEEPPSPLAEQEHRTRLLQHAGTNPDRGVDLALLGLVLLLPMLMLLVWFRM